MAADRLLQLRSVDLRLAIAASWWLSLAVALVAVLAYGESHGNREFFSIARDWVPLALTLVAYREMDWFTPLAWDHHLELRWIEWDRSLLYGWGFQRAIESLGALLPSYLEFCYLLVYAVGPFTVAVFYLERRRDRVNQRAVPVSAGHPAGLRAIPVFSVCSRRARFSAIATCPM